MERVLEQMDPRLLGARLQNARKAAGLTQQQMADALGVARTTVVAIEKGERRISAGELIQFASSCKRPVSDFVSKQMTEALVPQFRAMHELDVETEQVTFELQKCAEDFAELERITNMPAPRVYPPVYDASGAGPEEIAEEVAYAERARLGLGDGPAANLRETLETQVGIRAFYFPMPSRLAGVFAFNDSLGACIGINSNHPSDRRTWSLAHEYGHFLTNRYQAEITVLFTSTRLNRRERLADAFAENFTMPATGLNRRINDLQRSLPNGVSLAHICELASVYNVSVQAMVRRLENLKRLPNGTWQRLIAEGFKVRQAQQHLGISVVDIVPRFPTHYRLMALYAVRAGLISEGEFARFLRVDRLEARKIAESEPYKIHSEEEGFAFYNSDLAKPLTGS